jgi:hypothetical protein
MRNIQSPKIKKIGDTDTRKMPGPDPKRRISPKGLISIFVESVLVGFALFSAFFIQKIYFDLQDSQFLIGQGELIRMSLGIAYCYAFVSVLRRVYLYDSDKNKKVAAKQITGLVFETYIFYLALLFVVKDINFKSANLALGIGFLLSATLIFLYRFILIPILFKTKVYPNKRKITLKKSAPSLVPDERSLDIRFNATDALPVSRPDTRMDISGNEEVVDDPPRSGDHSVNSRYSGEPR